MVLSKADLAASLQNEINILVHLCSKVDPSQVDYRPNPKQRSNIEILRYLTVMGPALVPNIKSARFDGPGFGAKLAAANDLDLAAAVKSLASLSDYYAKSIPEFTDAELEEQIPLFGPDSKRSRGRWLADFVLCGHAAYRTQLFMNLKGSGREELNTANLWMGVDPAPKA